MEHPMIWIPVSDFNALVEALDAAIEFRGDQLVSDREMKEPQYSKWSEEYTKWNNLRKSINHHTMNDKDENK